VFSNKPGYLTWFVIRELSFRYQMVLPCKTFVEVHFEVFDRLYLRYDCLVDVHRGAMSSPEGECDV
jgi:hypothetical protein